MPVSPRTRVTKISPTDEFILFVGGVAYRARRYASVGFGGIVVCGYMVRREATDKPYLVTVSHCNCDAYRFRGSICKHMEAVRKLEEKCQQPSK